MRMVAVGTVDYAIQYDISLNTLKRDYLHPDWKFVDTDENTGVSYSQQRTAFWEYMAQPYTGNPINVQDVMQRKNYRVLRRVNFTLQPKLTNEPTTHVGAVPHFKVVKMFWNANRLQRYDWNDSSLAENVTYNAGSNGSEVFGFQQVGANNQTGSTSGLMQTTVVPSKRVYMMIRSSSPSYNGTTLSSATDPSFDLMVRICHETKGV
jgi:hypothetical protein